VRQPPPYVRTQVAGTAPGPTREERRIAAAYQREQEAMLAPTGIRSGSGISSLTSFPGIGAPSRPPMISRKSQRWLRLSAVAAVLPFRPR